MLFFSSARRFAVKRVLQVVKLKRMKTIVLFFSVMKAIFLNNQKAIHHIVQYTGNFRGMGRGATREITKFTKLNVMFLS